MGKYKIEYVEKNYIETSLDSFKNYKLVDGVRKQTNDKKARKRLLLKAIKEHKNFDDIKYIYKRMDTYSIPRLQRIYNDLENN